MGSGQENRLTVVFLTTSFPRFAGDFAGTFVYRFAEELCRLNCRIEVVSPHNPEVSPSTPHPENLKIRRFLYTWVPGGPRLAYRGGLPAQLKGNPLRWLWLPVFMIAFFLSGLAASRRAHLLHGFWLPGALVALLLGATRNLPVVIHLWGSDFKVLGLPIAARLLVPLLRRADTIICEGEPFAQSLEKMGFPENRIRVLPNGVDLDAFSPQDRAAARQTLGLPPDPLTIVTVGSLSPHKGQEYLIRSLPEIPRSGLMFRLYLIGDGEYRPQLQSLVDELKLNDYVTFAGTKKTDEVPLWLNAADIFVQPSLSEGNPNAVLEAMACGLPIVATRTGGLPQMIEDGVDGILIAPASAGDLARQIIALMQEPDRRKKLGANGLHTVRARYASWKTQAEILKAMYLSLLNPGSAT